jgi:hypothetical protein
MTDPATAERGRWYPDVPPALDGEDDAAYTGRLTGADKTGRVPYDHPRNRQCSIGYHGECTDPAGAVCKCPHHADKIPAGATITPAISAAAERLASLYFLPDATAIRVIMIAIESGRTTTPVNLRARIGEAYGSKISDWFVTDVTGILRSEGLR